jgi:hypothetical protein
LLISEDAQNRFEAKTKPVFHWTREVVPTLPLYINGAIDPPRNPPWPTLAKVFSNTIPAISSNFDILKTVTAFCGVGLVVSLLVASYGLDLSAGFF